MQQIWHTSLRKVGKQMARWHAAEAGNEHDAIQVNCPIERESLYS